MDSKARHGQAELSTKTVDIADALSIDDITVHRGVAAALDAYEAKYGDSRKAREALLAEGLRAVCQRVRVCFPDPLHNEALLLAQTVRHHRQDSGSFVEFGHNKSTDLVAALAAATDVRNDSPQIMELNKGNIAAIKSIVDLGSFAERVASKDGGRIVRTVAVAIPMLVSQGTASTDIGEHGEYLDLALKLAVAAGAVLQDEDFAPPRGSSPADFARPLVDLFKAHLNERSFEWTGIGDISLPFDDEEEIKQEIRKLKPADVVRDAARQLTEAATDHGLPHVASELTDLCQSTPAFISTTMEPVVPRFDLHTSTELLRHLINNAQADYAKSDPEGEHLGTVFMWLCERYLQLDSEMPQSQNKDGAGIVKRASQALHLKLKIPVDAMKQISRVCVRTGAATPMPHINDTAGWRQLGYTSAELEQIETILNVNIPAPQLKKPRKR